MASFPGQPKKVGSQNFNEARDAAGGSGKSFASHFTHVTMTALHHPIFKDTKVSKLWLDDNDMKFCSL